MTTHSRRTTLAGLAAISALLTGCTVESGSTTDSTKVDSAGVVATSPATSPATPIATADTGDHVNVSAPPTTDSTPVSSTNVVTFSGVGLLRVGMSEAQARQALGMPKAATTSRDECSYLDTNGRSHAFIMLARDTVVRFDVRDASLATEAGIHVGDPESRVLSAYTGRVTTQPHKYVSGGHYLIVSSPSDATRQLVFETDGKKVTTFRVGRVPEVNQVERCG